MSNVQPLRSAAASGFKTDDIEWQHLVGGEAFEYPIDYWIAVLGARPETGQIDFLAKWAPDAYCHFHRHLGSTTTLVLEGEHHVVETGPTETVHKIRTPGHLSRNPAGDVHMEYGGPQGSVVLFSMQSDDGRLFELLDRDENVLLVATIDDLVTRRLAT